jgi:hypothetical protein
LCRWSFEFDWLVTMLPLAVGLFEPTKSCKHKPDESVIASNPDLSIMDMG